MDGLIDGWVDDTELARNSKAIAQFADSGRSNMSVCSTALSYRTSLRSSQARPVMATFEFCSVFH